ncbi:MAG: xylulokinase [Chloroflexota bacterium]
MSGPHLLGVDLGTSSVKAMLVDTDEHSRIPIAQASSEYPLLTPHPGWSEQDPANWWRGVTEAIRQVVEISGVAIGDIAGMALSGQMHGATVLGSAHEVLRPCILWNDQRSGEVCAAITAQIGIDNLVNLVGNRALAGFTAPKLVWMREYEPEIYGRIETVLLPKDYINFRLTGRMATEPSDASGTLLFDVARRQWSNEMLDALNISPSLLPEVAASTDIVGYVTPEAAEATGLRAGMPVVAGGADNACAAVSMGVVRRGDVLTSIGTSGTVVAPTVEARFDPQARLHAFCHAVPDTWYLMGVVLSAGGSLRWFKDTVATAEIAQAEAESRDVYDVLMDLASRAPAGSDGLYFLPYLTGERTPHGDPTARGVFFGLSLAHTRAHMTRSVLEGVTYALADSVALMRDLGIDVSVIRATGGGAQSPLWRQILADVLNARILTSAEDSGPALGAAIIAGTGVGIFPSIPQAVDQYVQSDSETEPNGSVLEVYRRGHELYSSLYPALHDHFKTVSLSQ